MPARDGFRAAEMIESGLFLRCGHLGRFAGIEADENDFVVAAGIERKHAQSADDAHLNLVAQHRAIVINKGEDYGLLTEELAKLNAAAGFIPKMQVEGHLAVKRRLESHVAQSRRHSRSRGTRVRGNPMSAQRRTRVQQERGHPYEFACYIHLINSTYLTIADHRC